ncbi:MAG: ABC transporter ATP-binding protein, partial [Spirochaetes bacterium]|nr:ABC transporter ATP-binding protein [Spirochaetota bacterium]
MSTIEIRDIRVHYGAHEAVKDLSFICKDGAFTCILGPSGAGKTSTLKAVAGIVSLISGSIMIEGNDMVGLPPQKRNVAMTFEGYNLYPHYTVYENFAFPLHSPLRKGEYDDKAIDERIRSIAKLLEIDFLLDRYPKEISGGQKQRVALGRMLVRENPAAYLLDEPIAHLDAKLRHQMVGELKRIHAELKATMLYATPDAEEAIALADVIIFISEGQIVQIGTPEELILKPATMFVAEFVGEPKINFFPCTLKGEGVFEGETQKIVIDSEGFKMLQKKYAFSNGQRVNLAIRPQYCGFSVEKPKTNFIG